jgi:hypothetical protein
MLCGDGVCSRTLEQHVSSHQRTPLVRRWAHFPDHLAG